MSAPMNGSGEAVPAWMAELGIKPGEWLRMSKAQLRVLQRPSEDLHIQVWATGMLHSPGYNGQEAVILRNGKKVPLASGDIIRELHGVAKQYYAKAGLKLTDVEIGRLKEEKEHIRRAMVLLESYGVAMRTDGKGTPLQNLSMDQLRRLPSGRTRMFFWLKPKDADAEVVRCEWRRRQAPNPPPTPEPNNPEVATGWLPPPPIWKILNVLKVDKPEKAQLTNPEYQKAVEVGWQAARKVFLEVVTGRLPQVGAEVPPQVAAAGGALESKAESNEDERRAGGHSRSNGYTPKPEEPAPARPPDLLVQGLTKRKLLPDGDLLDRVRYVIGEMPVKEFFEVLDDRLHRGRITTGLLMDMAKKAAKQWEATEATRVEVPLESNEEKDRRQAEMFLASEDAPEDLKEWARGILASQAVGAGGD
jgi:hypothetical protein